MLVMLPKVKTFDNLEMECIFLLLRTFSLFIAIC